MILKNILHDLPSSVLIQDTWQQKGRPLLTSLVHHYSTKGFAVRYLRYDPLLANEQGEFSSLNFTPQLIELNSLSHKSTTSPEESLQKWTEADDASRPTILVIDSISPLLLHMSTGAVCSAIAKSSHKGNLHIVVLVHGDVHDDSTLKCLKYAFSCHLTLQMHNGENICSGTLRSPGGKITDSKDIYKIKGKWELTDIKKFDPNESKNIQPLPAANPTPKSTFRLELNQNEEKARSQVVLPYIRKQNEKTGQIVYETETADWEDEDPDDDLEI